MIVNITRDDDDDVGDASTTIPLISDVAPHGSAVFVHARRDILHYL